MPASVEPKHKALSVAERPVLILLVLALMFGGVGRLAAGSWFAPREPQISRGVRISLQQLTREPRGYAAILRVSAPHLVDPRLHDLTLAGPHGELCPGGRIISSQGAPDHTDLTLFFPANECFEAIPRAAQVRLAGVFEVEVNKTVIRTPVDLERPGLDRLDGQSR